MTPLSPDERAELARLCAAATPEPWTWDATMEQLWAGDAWLDFTGPDDPDTLLVMRARADIPRLLADLARVEGERDTLLRLRDGFLVRRADPSCSTCGGSGCAPDGSTCDCYGWTVRDDLAAILWADLRAHDAARRTAVEERDTARAESARLTRELAEARAEIARVRAYLDAVANEDHGEAADMWHGISVIDRARLNALAATGGEDHASVSDCANQIAEEKARLALAGGGS